MVLDNYYSVQFVDLIFQPITGQLYSQDCSPVRWLVERLAIEKKYWYTVLQMFTQLLFWAENQVIIKIEAHPWYSMNLWLIWMGMKKNWIFEFGIWKIKKNVIFEIHQFSIFLQPKFQGLNFCLIV